jgi:starch phosphorylase
VKEAAEHPRFKYFKETGEDSYHSFLGVPLIEQGTLQGVLVIQTIEPRGFTQGEVGRLVDAAARLGPIVSEARTLEHFIAPSQERLWKVARNLWWSWTPDVVELFRDIDPVRWRQLDHNPVSMLAEKSLKEIEQRAGQLVLHSRINHAYNRLREYVEAKSTWSSNHAGVLKSRPVAYFSAEFGLHESVPIYSGGLGVLAGDHVKSASDLGVPLIGIGLFYDQGYFHQRLDSELWQQEEYIDLNVSQLALQPAIGADGAPVCVQIETRSGVIQAAVWELLAGRCKLLLLGRVGTARRSLQAAAVGQRRGGQPGGGSRTDRPAVRRRHPHPDSAGTAAGCGRGARHAGVGDFARRVAPERGP